MSQFTSFEAKQIAAYLKASCSLVPTFPEPPKHSQWLDVISHSCGFRDWNAMTAVVPEKPETQWGEWYGAFFGIARVVTNGQDATNNLVWFRNRDSSRHETAITLARSVLARTGNRMRGLRFNYSQPDELQPQIDIFLPSITPLRSQHPWTATTPIIATSADRTTTIFLWWLSETYTMGEYYPERERRFSYQSLRFDDDGSPYTGRARAPHNPESLTDRFLMELTGVERPKRTCLYVPWVPNGPNETFIPVLVQEGSRTGKATTFNFGFDREAALNCAQELNFKNGVTIADRDTISRKFQEHEEIEDIFFEDFSGGYD